MSDDYSFEVNTLASAAAGSTATGEIEHLKDRRGSSSAGNSRCGQSLDTGDEERRWVRDNCRMTFASAAKGTAKIMRKGCSLFPISGTLVAVLISMVPPPANSDTGCAGYADPLNRAKSFWTRARAEQVRACVVQLGAGPGSDRRRLTPLHLAALFSADPAALAPLLKAGADPNARTRDGSTPLHAAAQKNSNPAVVAALLKAGADPTAVFLGKTAFDLSGRNARIRGSSAHLQLRKGQKATGATDAENGLTKADYRAIQRLLNRKGFKAGPEDGQWGPSSRSALQAFQARTGLPRTGVPDKATRAVSNEDAGGACVAGMELSPGQSCTHSAVGTFTVLEGGCANVSSIPIGKLCGVDINANGLRATPVNDVNFRIDALP